MTKAGWGGDYGSPESNEGSVGPEVMSDGGRMSIALGRHYFLRFLPSLTTYGIAEVGASCSHSSVIYLMRMGVLLTFVSVSCAFLVPVDIRRECQSSMDWS